MPVLNDIICKRFTTRDRDTGIITDADSLPTFEVLDIDSTVITSGDCTKRDMTIGEYSVVLELTEGNGFSSNEDYSVQVAVSVNFNSDKAIISNFFISGTSEVSIEPQDIADALKLAPSAGDPAEGSVYQLISVLGNGTGDTPVNHNTSGIDNIRYLDTTGSGIDNATILAFLKTDYDAGKRTGTYIKARSITNITGRFAKDIYLDTGNTYTIEFYKQGEFGPDTKEVTI
jgi:hypothetical protein